MTQQQHFEFYCEEFIITLDALMQLAIIRARPGEHAYIDANFAVTKRHAIELLQKLLCPFDEVEEPPVAEAAKQA